MIENQSPAIEQTNATLLAALISAFEALNLCLQAERDALVKHDREALERCVESKDRLCQQIAATLKHEDAKPLATLLSQDTPEELEPDHRKLFDLATTARESNLVNGKILHRSQQSLREILFILSGKDLDGLYGQSGQQDSNFVSGGSAIAQA